MFMNMNKLRTVVKRGFGEALREEALHEASSWLPWNGP